MSQRYTSAVTKVKVKYQGHVKKWPSRGKFAPQKTHPVCMVICEYFIKLKSYEMQKL